MIRDAYLTVQLRLHLPAGLLVIESAESGVAVGEAPPQPIHIVTAYNPRGRGATETENRRAQRALVEQLDGGQASHNPAAGADPAWLHVEPSVAIVGLTRQDAIDLGRRFNQDAVFEWTADALTVLSCTDDTTVALGWRQITPDARAVGADRAWRELGLASPYVPIAIASAALDRALEVADDQRAALLNNVFLGYAADYWAPRVEAERVRRSQRKEQQHEADRAAAAEARASEERREERRARQAEARKRNAAQHREHVEAGWPGSWRPRHVSQWVELGGDIDGARGWSEEGWSAADVVGAAAANGSGTNLPRSVGDPDEVAWWGDSLAGIAAGTWPQVPASTRVSVKRSFSDGRRDRWFVLPDAAGSVRVERWEMATPSATAPREWTSTVVAAYPTIEAALAGVRELSTLRPDVVCELNVARDIGVNLLEHLRVPRVGVDPNAEGPGIDEEAAVAAGLDLDEIARLVQGVPSRLVHCTVDGQPVVAVRTAQGWRWLTVGDDEIENGELAGETVVEYRWFSESGGAPISWDGGGSIGVVAPKLAVIRQWGDLGDGREFVTWPASAKGRARVVGQWIKESDLETVAALVLEPWPCDEQWLVWYDVSISDSMTRRVMRCGGAWPATPTTRPRERQSVTRGASRVARSRQRSSELPRRASQATCTGCSGFPTSRRQRDERVA
ncbi:hypothetical protein GCM10009868_26450 [Terrabacter aerolatus]|uniref:DUF3293 domain-containing protein n=1 Tax=Terrabacter aerolatus TaxID=422442 RepID=A0A512D5D4_9MICO|nr:DUF3293 domain-containing protein [Terrabacter aerolatus]GEO31683.1 hypothetical protein TAE01_34930 [Terrabacter aerolatus]